MRLPPPKCDRLRRLIGPSLAIFICTLCTLPVYAQTGPARIECGSMASAILGHAVDYCVALPPGYDADAARYPVLYFLHGLFENEKSWSERSGQQTWES